MPARPDRRRRSHRESEARVEDIVIGGHYRILERLGGGAFGEVYKGVDIANGTLVAMKMELSRDGRRSHLTLENKIYRRFNECPVTVGMPQTYFCGRVGDYTVMVMDLLGPSLEELFTASHRRFSPKTVCMLGVQIIQRIEYMHTVGYLHRDIKPENFVMGLDDMSHVVYVIDVGLSKAWRDAAGRHIPYAEGRSLTGTARYVSINTHRGVQQSRRDDMESVSYLLMYFLRGSLPWQGLKSPKNDVRYERIRDVKIDTSPEDLAEGYPSQLGSLVEYVRQLKFGEQPNYPYCVNLLLSALEDLNEPFDYCYQWIARDIPSCGNGARPSHSEQHISNSNKTAVAAGGSSAVTLSAPSDGNPSSSGVSFNFLQDIEDAYGY